MRKTVPALRSVALAGAFGVALWACDAELEGLYPTPAGDGPEIVFDLLAKPLPEIPFPNDMATRLDLDSPTGRRVNASLTAPTILEGDVRREFDLLDGWGTFAPMTVAFATPIDPVAVREAHLDDDFANDAVYLVNLKTGEPVALDLGRGNFPIVLQNNDKYFLNDPREKSSNMLFETYEEGDANGNGKLDPEEDTDGDGVWDHPNTLDPTKPRKGEVPDDRSSGAERGNDIYRDLMAFYERESNTLIIRPVVVLEQRTPYAVVLTNRIKGPDGKAIRSPFPFVNHAAQTEQLKPLVGFLGKDRLAGLTKDTLAFAWVFTTQSVTKDLEEIRKGLYGEGTLAWVGAQVDAKLEPVAIFNKKTNELETHPMHPLRDDPKNPYIVPMARFKDALGELGEQLGVDDGPDLDALVESYKFVEYFVIGSYKTANFLDDPGKPTFDAVFRVNPEKGLARVWTRPEAWADIEARAVEAEILNPVDPETAVLRQEAKRATRDRVWFMLAVPKELNGHKAPFPVSIYGHGYTSARVEFLGFAGNLAKFGVASVCIDSYGHGLDVSQTERRAIEAIIANYGFRPTIEAIFKGRARDLDNDLIDNSGGDFWVADTFHTRDIVRQSIIDWIQLIRVFRSFGTYDMGEIDGKQVKAGDFNADGIIDVGGPEFPQGDVGIPADRLLGPNKRNDGSDFFAWGQSLGGILSGILPAVEPAVAAAAPVAGGAGLADIGIRSEQGGVIQAVFMEILGPLFASSREAELDDNGQPRRDGNGQIIYKPGVHLNFQVQNVNDDSIIRITETPLDVRPGDKVVVHNRNLDNPDDKDDWAIVGEDLRFRLQIAADNASFEDGAPIPEEAVSYARCELEMLPDGGAARMKELKMIHPADCLEIQVWRKNASGAYEKVSTFDRFGVDVRVHQRDLSKPADGFQQRKFAKGSQLVALARGFGMKRGTKTFRRFMSLAQTILEPGDPGNYAKHYFQEPLEARKGNPAAVLVVGTTGDLNVPVNTAYAQARIAGVLPYVYDPAKHADWGMSPNDVLIRSKAMECLEKLRYYKPVADYLRAPEGERDALKSALHRDDQAIVDLVDCEIPESAGQGQPQKKSACEETALVDVSNYAYDPQADKFLDANNSTVPMRYGSAPRLKKPLREAVEASYDGLDAAGQKMTRKSALITPYLDSHGKHGFDVPHPADPFDVDLFMINLIGRYFQTRGAEINYAPCMHRDGFDRARLKGDGTLDTEATRVAGCEFIPEYPTGF